MPRKPKKYLRSEAAKAKALERFPGSPEYYSMPDRLRGSPSVKLTLPEPVHEMLGWIAEHHKVSKSAIVARLIYQEFSRLEAESQKQPITT